MRLLFFNRSFYPDVEATGQFLSELCQDLSHEHEVTVVAGRGYNMAQFGSWLPVRQEQWGRIRILRAYNPRLNKQRFLSRVVNLLSYFCFSFIAGCIARRPDVVVVLTDPPVLGLVAVFFARLYRAKLIFSVKDVYPEVAIVLSQIKSRALIKLLDASTQYTLSRADRVAVLGEDMAARMKAKGCCDESRIRVIPDWVDTQHVRPQEDRGQKAEVSRQSSYFSAERPSFMEQHGLDGQFVVMFSGNLGLSQDLERVIDVAGSFGGHNRIRFVFIGEGAAKAGLMAKARARQNVVPQGSTKSTESFECPVPIDGEHSSLVLKNVLFLPYQPREKLGESLGAADVHLVTLKRGVAGLIVPSKVYGILAAGRPFIAAIEEDSHVAGIIREHRCGVRIDPESTEQLKAAILWAAGNRKELEAMGQRGREAAVKHFDRKISVGKFQVMLEELQRDPV